MKRKTLRAKVLGGSQKFFWDTLQLFSSFLRGASCPKSPRVAATAASTFILDTQAFVKWLSSPASLPLLCHSMIFLFDFENEQVLGLGAVAVGSLGKQVRDYL